MKNKKNLHKTSTQGQSKPHLSVIIPTLNEIAYLPHLLDALAMQTRLPDEIIVADAGSKDGTAELAQSRGVRVMHGGMPAVGRNAGARAAKGDLLLFLDADVLPPPDFIARVLEEFEQKKTGCGDMLYRATRREPFGWNDLCGYKPVFADHPTGFPSCSRFLHPFEAYRPRKNGWIR